MPDNGARYLVRRRPASGSFRMVGGWIHGKMKNHACTRDDSGSSQRLGEAPERAAQQSPGPPSCGHKTELNPVGHTDLIPRNRVPYSATLTSARRLRAAETDMSVMMHIINEEHGACIALLNGEARRQHSVQPSPSAVASDLRDPCPGATTIRTKPRRDRRPGGHRSRAASEPPPSTTSAPLS